MYVCKDRSGKLEDLEAPDLTTIIGKLGFSGAQQVVEAVNEG